MSIRHNHDESFDRAMRDLHAQALTRVSPQTRARLRAARTAADTRHAPQRAPMRGLGWVLAGGCAAVFALAIGLQWRGPSSTANVPTQTAGTEAADDSIDSTDSAVDALDENPDLYLWLASNDDALPNPSER